MNAIFIQAAIDSGDLLTSLADNDRESIKQFILELDLQVAEADFTVDLIQGLADSLDPENFEEEMAIKKIIKLAEKLK